MKLVIITGPHAVGKMTVGQELERLTGLKLFHNHMTIDIVCELFANMPSERMRLTELFREEIFKSFAKSGEYGMIFTYMWAFDSQEDWDYIEHVKSIFEDAEAKCILSSSRRGAIYVSSGTGRRTGLQTSRRSVTLRARTRFLTE